MMTVSANAQQFLTLKQQIQLLSLPPQTRRLLLRKAAFSLRKVSRKNIRQQENVTGQAFDPRKKGRKKMLRGLSRKMVAYANPQQGVVTWKNPVTGSIARVHQEGIDETMTAADMQRQYGKPDYSEQATRSQAKALKQAGFKARKAGKGYRNVTIKWITENMTIGQAGLILKQLRGPGKTTWQIPVPERRFLGVDRNELGTIINTAFNDITDSMGAT